MSSIICFPFWEEEPEVVFRNIKEGAASPEIKEILLVGKEKNECYAEIESRVDSIEKDVGKKITTILQKRLGNRCPGKGDGINTALEYFLQEERCDKIHFYDADITTFNQSWIEKAEKKVREGFEVVRDFFPRPSTDGMVTWHVTKIGFAMLWPGTELPKINQPLGGEILLTKRAVEKIWEGVKEYSNWSIDTAVTFQTVKHNLPMAEIYIPEGKMHRLYGTLGDLRQMLIECFAIFQDLKGEKVDNATMRHKIETEEAVPEAVKSKVGYDVEGTLALLKMGWTESQVDLLQHFPDQIRDQMMDCRDFPKFKFMDIDNWITSFRVLLDNFDRQNEDWKELLFKLWVTRVLHYTINHALRGYDHGIAYLNQCIREMEERSLKLAKTGK
jgi:mannosylglycerate synthase